MNKFLLALLVFISAASVSNAATDKVVCYFGSWAVYRSGNGKFDVEDINPNLCTHIIYAFVGVSANGDVLIKDDWNEIQKRAFERFVGLKQRNPAVKLMVAIGGWNEGSVTFSNVCNNPSTRATFVNNIVAFTKKYKFDGFDIDWEYPGDRGGATTDRAAFVSLIKELRPRFDAEKLILSAAVQALKSYHTTAYNVPEMNKYLDFVNIMTYDFHGSYDGITGQDAPLYASPGEAHPDFNVDAAVTGWIADGLAPEKLILGMGVYGRSFTLGNPSITALGALSAGAGAAGPYTAEPGMLSYLEICEQIKAGGWTRKWDSQQMVPFIFKNNQWVGYDDVQSIKIKSQYAKDKKLGGAMIWSIEMDDAKNVCGGGNFPILQTINDVLKSSGGTSVTSVNPTSAPVTSSPTITTAPVTTKPTTATTSGQICVTAGFVRDSKDCSVFYQCATVGSLTPSKFACPAGLYFDVTINSCNYINQVKC